ncbi:MAG: hypothetical protein JNL01_03920 [Bdellovibrionales bacterium]|nr:hypothetical protein [Bdellovibrionales bacterium]
MSIKKISSGLFLVKMVRALGSILLLVLMARFFGSDLTRDAYVLALGWGTVLGMILYGPVNEVVRAEFVHQKNRFGEIQALASFRSLVGSMIGMGILGGAVLLVLVHTRVLNLVPGYDAAAFDVFSQMILITLPLFLLNQLTSAWSSLLNAYGFYYYPDFFGTLSTVLQIALMILFRDRLGVLSLVLAAYLANIAFVLALGYRLLKSTPYRRAKFHLLNPQAWVYFRLGFPFYASYVIAQGASAVERILLTQIGIGAASNLDYARKFSDFPTGVFMAVIASVLVPRFAELHSAGKKADLRKQFMKFFVYSFSLMTGLALFLFFFAAPILKILFGQGRLSPQDQEIVARTVAIGAIGLPGILLYTLSGQSWVAMRRPGIFAWAGSISATLGVAIAWMTYQSMGAPAFLLGWSAAHWMGGVVLFVLLLKELNKR